MIHTNHEIYMIRVLFSPYATRCKAELLTPEATQFGSNRTGSVCNLLLSVVCVMPPKLCRVKRRVRGKTSKQERLNLQQKHKTVRRAKRRKAVKELLDVAAEVGVSATRVNRGEPTGAEVTRLIRALDARELPAETTARVRTAAQLWLDGHGELDAELLESDSDDKDDEYDSPSVVLQHAILKPTFKLQSKAFMLTYNSRAFTTGDWNQFRRFVKNLRNMVVWFVSVRSDVFLVKVVFLSRPIWASFWSGSYMDHVRISSGSSPDHSRINRV